MNFGYPRFKKKAIRASPATFHQPRIPEPPENAPATPIDNSASTSNPESPPSNPDSLPSGQDSPEAASEVQNPLRLIQVQYSSVLHHLQSVDPNTGVNGGVKYNGEAIGVKNGVSILPLLSSLHLTSSDSKSSIVSYLIVQRNRAGPENLISSASMLLSFSSSVSIKTEGGAKVKANKTGIYKKWRINKFNCFVLLGVVEALSRLNVVIGHQNALQPEHIMAYDDVVSAPGESLLVV
nr:importin-5-like [Ipomoea trifida]